MVLVKLSYPPLLRSKVTYLEIKNINNVYHWFSKLHVKCTASRVSGKFTYHVRVNRRKEFSCLRVYAIYYFIFHFAHGENCAVACRARSLSW